MGHSVKTKAVMIPFSQEMTAKALLEINKMEILPILF
jgi:hypothetical protein